MPSEEKVVARGRGRKKQPTLECLATTLKKKRGRKPRSSSPPPPNPCPLSFFKVLIGDFHEVLFIPPMAACILKGLAKNYVFIKDIDGKIWTVKISIVDGSLAFQNGWHDFVSDHSITVGEFVLFTYTGGLLFTARIFGTSSLERVNFQMKRRKGKCAKERCASDLKLVNITIPERQKKVSQSSEEKHSPSGTEALKF
ncbi:B3 domain-containing protein Os02g0598200-like [Phalaenopsis equestris]|uniref:B3 domain-containing protein Os02g0598200-like n=1 Tax=Phalaenopsis equestris TaxID=78828 RepID=UPI0009E4959D|nr:B3 domain-containing protein Os02g0598200-like [Phalaenopsis equestris]